jgi:hypothetical protein
VTPSDSRIRRRAWLRQREGAPSLGEDRVPAGMAVAIAAALNVDPSRRPATAAAFAAMLQ